MTLLSEIVEKDNVSIETAKAMKENGHPVVLCGAGFLGRTTYDFLFEAGINVDMVAVNRRYIKEQSLFLGKKIIPLKDIISCEGKFNYVVSFHFFNEYVCLKEDLQRSAAASILFCDPSFLGINTKECITYEFCSQNVNELEWFNHQLEDELSRRTLAAFINQRICVCTDSRYYNSVYRNNHYFTDDIINFSSDEVFVDCVAYTGDTIASLLTNMKQVGIAGPKKIFAFEPDKRNFSLLIENTRPLDYCTCFNQGAWSSKTTLHFSGGKGEISGISPDGSLDSIETSSIDAILAGEKATFIKMDIEGAELEALRGAEKTISCYKPKLAISLYHKPEDLLTIPRYLKMLHPAYKFYLRAHTPYVAHDLVLYAI